MSFLVVVYRHKETGEVKLMDAKDHQPPKPNSSRWKLLGTVELAVDVGTAG